MSKQTLWALGVIALVLLISFSLLLNPGDVLTPHSSGFTEERFRSIKSGTDEQEVIAILGDPIIVRTIDDSTVFPDLVGCKSLVFMGMNPPDWLWISFTDAWVVSCDGKVVEKHIIRE